MHKTVWLVHPVIRKHRLSLIHSSKVPIDKLMLNSVQTQKYNWCQPKFSAKDKHWICCSWLCLGFRCRAPARWFPWGRVFVMACAYVCVCFLILQTSFICKANKEKAIHSLLESQETTNCWVLSKLHIAIRQIDIPAQGHA